MKVIMFMENVREIVSLVIKNELGYLMFAYIGVLLLMLVDILTGFTQAKVNHELASHRMSDGLLKKFNILMVLLVLFHRYKNQYPIQSICRTFPHLKPC